MSAIIVSKQKTTNGQTSTDRWADVDGMVDTVDVGSASSVLLMIATVPILLDDNVDEEVAFRFKVDSTQEGPELKTFKDEVDEGCGRSICWATTASAASHTFSIQWISVASKHAQLDTGRTRSFQVIEITDATILVNKTGSTNVWAATTSYSDITDLTDTQTVTAGSVLLVLGNLPQVPASDNPCVFVAMSIGGTREGPETMAGTDEADEGCDASSMWVKDGISGSTAFALQGFEGGSTPGEVTADTGRIRSLQVIQITANVNKLTSLTSISADVLTGSYTDVVDLVDTGVTVDGTGSILLFASSAPQTLAGDNTSVYRFYEGTTGEGPEVPVFMDSTVHGCGHSLYWAATGKSAGDHTFSLRGANVAGTANLSEAERRSLMIVELKAAAAGGVNIVPLLMQRFRQMKLLVNIIWLLMRRFRQRGMI